MRYIQDKFNLSVWGDLMGWSVSPVSTKRTITAPLTLTARDSGRQVISAATTQDVTLPDATTLNDAFESVGTQYAGRTFTIQAEGAYLNVRDFTGTFLTQVKNGRACTFTLTDASTAAGTWHVCCCGTELPYVDTFQVAEFVVVGAGNDGRYEFSIPATTHGKGVHPIVTVRDSLGNNIYPDINVDASGNVKLIVSYDAPDGRFDGQVIII